MKFVKLTMYRTYKSFVQLIGLSLLGKLAFILSNAGRGRDEELSRDENGEYGAHLQPALLSSLFGPFMDD